MSDEEVNEQAEEEQDDLRGLLEEAFTDDEPEQAEEPQAEDAAEDGDPPAEAGEADGQEPESSPGEPGPTGKPPIDWGPDLREQWTALSPAVQQKISAREAQIAEAMQGTAQARGIANDFQTVVQQYGSIMAAEGAQNPMDAVQGILQTVSELRMGTAQQKAQKMAELIQRYDIDIGTLDNALAGKIDPSQAPAQGANPDVEAMIDQRMQPVNQMMQQLAYMQQQRQAQTQQTAAQEVQEFAQKAEFLNDVRQDVADLIDLATRQGREMTLQEAYDKACAMNPKISQVLNDRSEQQRLAEAGKSVASKKAASVSLRPSGINASPSSSGTLYDDLMAAWDENAG